MSLDKSALKAVCLLIYNSSECKSDGTDWCLKWTELHWVLDLEIYSFEAGRRPRGRRGEGGGGQLEARECPLQVSNNAIKDKGQGQGQGQGVKFATRPTTSGYSNAASSKMKQSEDIVALGPGLQSLVDTMKEDYNRLNLDQPSDDEVISPPVEIYRWIQYSMPENARNKMNIALLEKLIPTSSGVEPKCELEQ